MLSSINGIAQGRCSLGQPLLDGSSHWGLSHDDDDDDDGDDDGGGGGGDDGDDDDHDDTPRGKSPLDG